MDQTQKIIHKLLQKNSNPKLIEEAFALAKEVYANKKRASGQTYLEHAVNVALILDGMRLDSETIVAGLLHDVTDTSSLSPEIKFDIKQLEKQFGKDISHIIEQSAELKKVYYSFHTKATEEKLFQKEKVENLRKMFFAIAKDLRVILIELASRLDGLSKISDLPQESQRMYAIETMQIFVPIANRLGLGEVKKEMEDLAFKNLFPERFNWLEEKIKEQYKEREIYLKKFVPHIKKILHKERVPFTEIGYREKSYWSTYQELTKHDMDFGKIHDLIALRVIVGNIEQCYKVLGAIHQQYQPLSGSIKDYIAKPKPNGYQSLHTSIYLERSEASDSNKKIIEVQIRTNKMHQEAQFGVCAHWAYKEKINLHKERDIFNWTKEIPSFWKTFSIDFFADQVFAFTPKGDVIVLPKESTPIDFAYAIHSDIGNHCQSAKINNKMVPLSYQLKNGDIVAIETNKNKTPSKDWLRIVKTSFAKSNIKKLTEQPTSRFAFPIPGFIKKTFIEFTEARKKKKEEVSKIKKENPPQIHLAGQKGILMRRAKCCNPKSGDKVKAYLAPYRGAVLHRTSCSNFKKIAEKFPDKIIDASWQ